MKVLTLLFILFAAKSIFSQDTTYYGNGRIKTISSKNDKGNLDGPYCFFSEIRENDTLISGVYIDGKKNGEWIYKNYSLAMTDSIYTYLNGIKHGPYKKYEKEIIGKGLYLKESGKYSNGKLDGEIKFYDSGLEKIKRYRNGIQYWEEIYYNVLAPKATMDDIHKGAIKNGKEDGLWKTYYSDSLIKSEFTYVNGVQQGLRTNYFRNGKVKSKLNFIEGSLSGALYFYTPEGKLSSKAVAKNDEIINGTVTSYDVYDNENYQNFHKDVYENKEITITYYYKNNKLYYSKQNVNNRFIITVYKNDKIISRGRYFHRDYVRYDEIIVSIKNDIPVECIVFDTTKLSLSKSGKLYDAKAHYKDGSIYMEGKLFELEEGEWKTYYKNGKIKSIITYKNGIRNGLLMFFDENGNCTDSINYINGLRDGLCKIKSYGDTEYITYKNGKKNGEYTKIYESGEIEHIGFQDGRMNGKYIKTYNNDTLLFGYYINNWKEGEWVEKSNNPNDEYYNMHVYYNYESDLVRSIIIKSKSNPKETINYFSRKSLLKIKVKYNDEGEVTDSVIYDYNQVYYRPLRFIKDHGNVIRYYKHNDSNSYGVDLKKNEYAIEWKNYDEDLIYFDVYNVDSAGFIKKAITIKKDWKGITGYKNNLNKTEIIYYPDGVMKSRQEKDSYYTYYHNGLLESKITIDGYQSRDKTFEYYLPNGSLIVSGKTTSEWGVNELIPIGLWTWKNEDGSFTYSKNINDFEKINQTIDGKKEGTWIELMDHFLYSIINYKNGKQNGKFYYFHIYSNEIKMSGNSRDGLLTDTLLVFNKIGNLVTKNTYKKGVLISTANYPKPSLVIYDTKNLLQSNVISLPSDKNGINPNYTNTKSINGNFIVSIYQEDYSDKYILTDIKNRVITKKPDLPGFNLIDASGDSKYLLLKETFFYGEFPTINYALFNLYNSYDFQLDYNDEYLSSCFSDDSKYLYILSILYPKTQQSSTNNQDQKIHFQYIVKNIDSCNQYYDTKTRKYTVDLQEVPINLYYTKSDKIVEIYKNKLNYRDTKSMELVDSIVLNIKQKEGFQFIPERVEISNGFIAYFFSKVKVDSINNDYFYYFDKIDHILIVDVESKQSWTINKRKITGLDKNNANYNKLFDRDTLCFIDNNHIYYFDLKTLKLTKKKNPLKTSNLYLSKNNEWFCLYNSNDNSNLFGYNTDNKKRKNRNIESGWYSFDGKMLLEPIAKINQYTIAPVHFKDNALFFENKDNHQLKKLDLSTGLLKNAKESDISLNTEDTIHFINNRYIGKYNGGNFSSLYMKDGKIINTSCNPYKKTTKEITFINPLYPYRKGREVKWEYFSNDAYIFYCPDKYYLTSKNAADIIKFELNLKVFPLQQFDLKYNRPDIILDRLGYADSSLVAAYHQAYLKRLKKMGFTEEMLKDDFHLPEIKIEDFEEMPTIIDSSSVGLNLQMNDSKYKLDRINVWVNDVAVYGTKGISLRDKNVSSYKTNLRVNLVKGKNKIQISVLNQAGAESYKETFEIECKAGKSKPDLYLITIGESEFKDANYNLTYAAKDARDVASLFTQSKVYNKVITKTLTNEQVTKENIAALRSFIEQAGINDEVIIFIAGHGVLDKNLDYYFASYDMDFHNPGERGIAYGDLESLLDGIKPLKKVLLIDACHSGEIDKEEVDLLAATEVQNGDIQFRAVGNTVQPKLGMQNTSELTKALFTDLRKGTGATVISSAGGGEYAMESGEWKNGLFTYCLIKGIETKAADLNGDGEIWLKELQEYVQTQVTELSGGKQQPTSRIENSVLDYRVW